MARPRSEEKRDAIIAASIRIIAEQGISAPTAMIAREAGVSNGALFTYFNTKADLLNQLYIVLKTELAEATAKGLPAEADMHAQLFHLWTAWINWSIAWPLKRRALAQLAVSHDITEESQLAVSRLYAEVAALLDRSRTNGALRDAPLMFVASLVIALVDATVGHITRNPANGDADAAAGFAALLRMLA